jgi:hypothetical protein
MTVSNALANRRQLRRHKLSEEIAILDSSRSEAMGKLVDIHQEGLLLLGKPFVIDSLHQFSLMLPNSINGQTHIEIGVECLWCQASIDDDTLFWVGFTIIDKSKNATAGIQSLINITAQ